MNNVVYKNYPIKACQQRVAEILATGATLDFYQKFTCDGCGSRQTMGDPNVWYATGKCEECGTITDIEKHGCNYVVHFGLDGKGRRDLKSEQARK